MPSVVERSPNVVKYKEFGGSGKEYWFETRYTHHLSVSRFINVFYKFVDEDDKTHGWKWVIIDEFEWDNLMEGDNLAKTETEAMANAIVCYENSDWYKDEVEGPVHGPDLPGIATEGLRGLKRIADHIVEKM